MRNGKNIRGALSYNEAKVREGKAELILGSRYGCGVNDLNFSQKLKRFTDLNDKCVTSSFNTVHVSLNFSPEDLLDTEKMQLIARDYMQALGFEKQPYLVYRHDDTAHPHLHIVTTPVKPNGRVINLHNLVQRKSEPARKAIEETYGLIKAEGRSQSQVITPIEIQAVNYGKEETKHAVAQVVRHVCESWKFTNLPEYNLILKEYGVFGEPGKAGERMRQYRGLVYYIINAKGEKVSVPIKASSIYGSPTLPNLEKRFASNLIKKQAFLGYTARTVRTALARSKNENQFLDLLNAKQIRLLPEGESYRFIDFRNRTVSTSGELGISNEQLQSLHVSTESAMHVDLTILQKLFENEYTGPDLAAAFLIKKKRKKK